MTSHGIVLFYVAANPQSTMRQMAEDLVLSERRVTQVIGALVQANLLATTRVGRQNSYAVNREASFRHPTLSHVTLGQFEELLLAEHQAALPTPEGDSPA